MDSDSEWEAFWIWHAREAGRSPFIQSEDKMPLHPEDRGTPKDPSFGAHERRYEEAKATDPEGVAAYERRSRELLEQGRKKRKARTDAIGVGPGSVRRRAFIDTSSDLHPYECDGPGKCVHCDQRPTYDHDPNNCALCDDGERAA